MSSCHSDDTKTPPDITALPAEYLRHLPFFFYGTLQTGFKNHTNVVRGRYASVVPAALPGADLFHYAAGWPGITDGAGVVIGQLLYAHDAEYLELLSDLDTLEGEPLSHSLRALSNT